MTTDHKNHVHQVVNLKGPLKGKGGAPAQWHADAKSRLAQMHQQMAALAAESRRVQPRRFALALCGQRSGRQLRWRVGVEGFRSWQRVRPLLRACAPGLAQWYEQAALLALLLNHREQVLRYELRTAARLAKAVEGLVPSRDGSDCGPGRKVE